MVVLINQMMGLSLSPRLYKCYKCGNAVALQDDVVSREFRSRSGRAFLFSHARNVFCGLPEDRQMMTGLHLVADVHCGNCQEVLG